MVTIVTITGMQPSYTLQTQGRVHVFDMTAQPWQATANPGLWLKPVRMDDDKGHFLGLVRFDAFTQSGLHQHQGVATSLVIQGGLTDYHGPIRLHDAGINLAGSTHDAVAYEDTVLGENTKIDNLVQIAHNVRVGRNCVMAAHTGISGSVTIGDGAAFGGRAGVGDHIIIGEGAQIGAGAGVLRDVPPKVVMGGYPAVPLRQWLREVAWLSKAAALRRREEPDQ